MKKQEKTLAEIEQKLQQAADIVRGCSALLMARAERLERWFVSYRERYEQECGRTKRLKAKIETLKKKPKKRQ